MSRAPREPNVASVRILIVDDSAPMRDVVRSVVADLGFETRDCDNGLDAIVEYRDWRPDWVVMDVRMPGIDGVASTRMIRGEFPEARIVVVSIHRSPELRDAAKAAGARCFLHKSHLYDLPAIFAADKEERC